MRETPFTLLTIVGVGLVAGIAVAQTTGSGAGGGAPGAGPRAPGASTGTPGTPGPTIPAPAPVQPGVGTRPAPGTPPIGSDAGATQPRPSVGQPSIGSSPPGAVTPGTAMPGTPIPGTTPGTASGTSTLPPAGAGYASAGQVRSAQQALQGKGMDPGPIDGVAGPKTQQALRDFQRDQNLAQTGQLDAQTLQKLGVPAQ